MSMAGGLQSVTDMRPPIAGVGGYVNPYEKPLEEATRAQAETNAATQQFEGEQGIQKAQGAAQVERTFADKSAALPQRGEMRGVSADMGKPFVPTQESTKDLTALFSLVNIIGFGIGAGGKQHAQAAMSAMDGMLKGHQQGREDLYKQEKGKFDENMKALKTRFDSLDRELKDALDTYKSDKEAGLREIEVTLAQHKADFLRQYKDKLGVGAMADVWKQLYNAHNKAHEVQMREEDRHEQRRMQAERMAQADRHHAEQMQIERDRLEFQKAHPNAQQAKHGEKIDAMIDGYTQVEDLQRQLRDPEVVTGLKAKAAPLLEKLKSLGSDDFESAVNKTLSGPDKTTLFLKDALLATYAIERAAKGGQRLTVQDMRMVGPVLDPTNYTPETYNRLLDSRRRQLYQSLRRGGVGDDEIAQRAKPFPYKPFLTGKDAEAWDWAEQHPDDPRSTQIKSHLGGN